MIQKKTGNQVKPSVTLDILSSFLYNESESFRKRFPVNIN